MTQNNNELELDIRRRQLELEVLTEQLKQQRVMNRKVAVELNGSMSSFFQEFNKLKGALRRVENAKKSDAKSDFTPPSSSPSTGSTPYS